MGPGLGLRTVFIVWGYVLWLFGPMGIECLMAWFATVIVEGSGVVQCSVVVSGCVCRFEWSVFEYVGVCVPPLAMFAQWGSEI